MDTLIPSTHHAKIKIVKLLLNVETPTMAHFEQVKEMIAKDLHVNNLSPAQIRAKYQLTYTDFGMFIKRVLGLELKSTKDAVNNYYTQTGRSITDEKTAYYRASAFSFDPYSIPEIPGFNLMLERGIYHPTTNRNGMCRDHMVSRAFGFRNKIPAEIIASPFNCQWLTNIDNLQKNECCDITIDELLHRIANQTLEVIKNRSTFLSKTTEHKKKISEANKKYMNITDGLTNRRVLKTLPVPTGWTRGMTRKIPIVTR